MSLPASMPVRPAASAAAEPPDEPPGVRVVSHGFWCAVDRIVALPIRKHGRHVAFAEQSDAGVDHALRRYGGFGGDVVFQPRDAPGGRRARDLETLLDGHRDAMQRAEALALLLQCGIRRFRALARLVAVHPDDGIERRIVFFDPRQEVVEQFERAHLLASDQRGKLGRGLVVQLIHRECPERGGEYDFSAAMPGATIARVTLSPPPCQIHDKSTTLFCPHDRRALTRACNAT